MNNILFVSHCVINEFSKVVSFKTPEEYEYDLMDFLKFIHEENIGIVQLPCPEMHCYGLKRWGHVKEQFDHPHYRDECRKMFKPYLNQIIEYRNNGDNVLGIMGIFGSPSCGVFNTCVGDWYGEIGSNENLDGMISTIKRIDGSGVFIEVIERILEEECLKLPLFEYNKKTLDETMKMIKENKR